MIDINVISIVFNENTQDHHEFCHVKRYIMSGNGALVFGGSHYFDELKGMTTCLNVILQLSKQNKVVRIKDDVVDAIESEIIFKTKGTNCDDQHIIAILAASRCPLLCSRDTESFEFIHNKQLYRKRTKKVKIYSSARNKDILVRTNRSILTNTV